MKSLADTITEHVSQFNTTENNDASDIAIIDLIENRNQLKNKDGQDISIFFKAKNRDAIFEILNPDVKNAPDDFLKSSKAGDDNYNQLKKLKLKDQEKIKLIASWLGATEEAVKNCLKDYSQYCMNPIPALLIK